MADDISALVKELRELLEKATPGPWEWSSGNYALYGAKNKCVMAARDGAVYSEYSSDPADIKIPNDADRSLVVSARNHLPALLDALERGREETIEECAKVAEHPYSDAVAAFGPDEPLAVGAKIAAALRSLSTPGKG